MPEAFRVAIGVGQPGTAAVKAAGGRWAAGGCLAVSLLLLPALCGCAVLSRRDAPEITAPTVPPTPDNASKPAARKPASTAASPAPTPAAVPANPAPPAAPVETFPLVIVQLSAEERDRLTKQVDEDARLARERLDRVDRVRMTPESSERLEAVRELLGSAEEARARDDLRSAALLARKARILAQNLPGE